MLKLSLRSLLMHKLRLFLTVAAVTVGVAFVSGTFVLSDTMSKAFDELYAGLTKGTDVAVRAKASYTDITTQGQVRPLDDDVVERVADVPGVAVAEGSVTGFALVLDKDGEPVQPGGAPTLGASTSVDERLAGDFSYREGRAPTAPDEVALDAATAAKAGYTVGDRAGIVFQDGTGTFTVVGVVGFGETDSLAGATMAAFETSTAQKLLGKTGRVDQVAVVADTRPIAAASTTMPPSTWRRVAPTERSSATSRRRWATRTLKVFQMTKEPTNTETAAKTSRMFVNMPRPSRTAAELSSASSRPVSASDPAGRTAAMSSRSSSALTPSSATTATWSTWPALPSSFWAVPVSNAAIVAPARLSVSPKPTTPTTVKAPVPSWKTMPARSPTV